MTYPSGLVLQAIATGHRYGFDVMDLTGLPSGTVYPALRKLERVGHVRSKWEGEDLARRAGRPPRRYYEISGSGSVALAELVKRFPGLERALAARGGTLQGRVTSAIGPDARRHDDVDALHRSRSGNAADGPMPS